jgi:hypothetical protein
LGLRLTILSHKKTFGAKPLQLLNDPVGLHGRHGNGKWNRKRNAILTVATWNVRLLLQPEKKVEIADDARKFKVNILAIPQTRWPGQGRTDKQNYSVFYSG